MLMQSPPDVTPVKKNWQHLADHCHAYKGADPETSMVQLSVTLALFLVTCASMMFGAVHEIYWSLLLILPASGLLVRLFVIQHDCGHGSYFKSRRANDLTGRFLSLLTFTPYGFWRNAHNMHHSGSGNLGRRGLGSIDTLTVKEYRAMSWRRRMAYRLYRSVFLLLVIGTPLHIILLQRIPPMPALSQVGNYRSLPSGQVWLSILSLDFAIMFFYGLAVILLGWKVVLMTYLPVLVITSWVGGWLFFIQHQFEDTHWKHDDEWEFQEAALLGSSYYALPPILQWFTGSIGLHHIHHLCALIPNYKLQKCLDGHPELQAMNRMTLKDSLKCIRWTLWDEDKGRMVSFKDCRT